MVRRLEWRDDGTSLAATHVGQEDGGTDDGRGEAGAEGFIVHRLDVVRVRLEGSDDFDLVQVKDWRFSKASVTAVWFYEGVDVPLNVERILLHGNEADGYLYSSHEQELPLGCIIGPAKVCLVLPGEAPPQDFEGLVVRGFYDTHTGTIEALSRSRAMVAETLAWQGITRGRAETCAKRPLPASVANAPASAKRARSGSIGGVTSGSLCAERGSGASGPVAASTAANGLAAVGRVARAAEADDTASRVRELTESNTTLEKRAADVEHRARELQYANAALEQGLAAAAQQAVAGIQRADELAERNTALEKSLAEEREKVTQGRRALDTLREELAAERAVRQHTGSEFDLARKLVEAMRVAEELGKHAANLQTKLVGTEQELADTRTKCEAIFLRSKDQEANLRAQLEAERAATERARNQRAAQDRAIDQAHNILHRHIPGANATDK